MKYLVCLLLPLCLSAAACGKENSGGPALGLGYPMGVVLYANPDGPAGFAAGGYAWSPDGPVGSIFVNLNNRSGGYDSSGAYSSSDLNRPRTVRPPRAQRNDAAWNDFDRQYHSPLGHYRDKEIDG